LLAVAQRGEGIQDKIIGEEAEGSRIGKAAVGVASFGGRRDKKKIHGPSEA
jgi:hypothetical protein